MIAIDQDAMGKHCKENEIDNPDTCEGYSCGEARDSYYDAHGLVENDNQTFSDIKRGDPLWRIEDRKITMDKVSSVLHNSNGLQIGTDKHSATKFQPTLSMKKITYNQCTLMIFVRREDAVKAYRELITKTMERMINRLMVFEKGE